LVTTAGSANSTDWSSCLVQCCSNVADLLDQSVGGWDASEPVTLVERSCWLVNGVHDDEPDRDDTRRCNNPRERVRKKSRAEALPCNVLSTASRASRTGGIHGPAERPVAGIPAPTPPGHRNYSGLGRRRIPEARTSRMLTTPVSSRPSTTGRWRNPLVSITSAASSVVVSGVAVIGSLVIH
jgi:hypothetical protein